MSRRLAVRSSCRVYVMAFTIIGPEGGTPSRIMERILWRARAHDRKSMEHRQPYQPAHKVTIKTEPSCRVDRFENAYCSTFFQWQ